MKCINSIVIYGITSLFICLSGCGGGSDEEQNLSDRDLDGISNTEDCATDDHTRWRNVMVYADFDGDGVGAGDGTLSCIGANADAGYSVKGYDPNDNPSDPNSSDEMDFDIPNEFLIAIDSDGEVD